MSKSGLESDKFNLLDHIMGKDDFTVIWMFSIGIEKYWNGEVFTVKNSKEDVIVNHMEEMNILITRRQDILILREMPDEIYLKEMENFGLELPTIVCPGVSDETKAISELVLEDTLLQERIRSLVSGKKAVFVPYGVSDIEERLAKIFSVELFGSACEVNRRINNKVFSRKFAIEHGFKVAPAYICSGYDELCKNAQIMLEEHGKIIIKEPCGASGKGLWVVESQAKLKSALLIIRRFFKEQLEGEWLVEKWCDKAADLNYQVYVGNGGEVEVFSIKEQKVDGTVYVGSLIPPEIDEKIVDEINKAGLIIGKALYDEGYRGVLGIDAMLLSDKSLIPIIEINGRFTLSTYVSFVNNKIGLISPEFKARRIFAFYKKIPLDSVKNYDGIMKRLKEEGLWIKNYRGILVYTQMTVMSEIVGGHGRLFGLILADSAGELERIYQKTLSALDASD